MEFYLLLDDNNSNDNNDNIDNKKNNKQLYMPDKLRQKYLKIT